VHRATAARWLQQARQARQALFAAVQRQLRLSGRSY
jgi:hypothetical protein